MAIGLFILFCLGEEKVECKMVHRNALDPQYIPLKFGGQQCSALKSGTRKSLTRIAFGRSMLANFIQL